jgi:MFS family permease
LNMLIPVGFILGAPICGYIADRVHSKINFLTFLLTVQTGIWVCLTFGSSVLETGCMIPILVFLGAMSGGLATVLWALVRETTREIILGTTTGLINPFGLIGAASLQVLTGVLLDRVGRVNDIYPPSAYSDAFIICLSITASCLILSCVFRRYLSGKG